jgi:hypothetical protein
MSTRGTNTTTHAQTKERSMTTRLTRLAVGACAGACLALTMVAAPASADVKPETGPPAQTAKDSGLDATSIALGALGGIAFAGAGLGITLGVQRRRDHTTPHPA